MNTYYFVGGPIPGKMDEFRRRLDGGGGPPPGWLVLPHASGDGRALHVVQADSREAVLRHLALFDGIYAHDAIVEVRAPRSP
ncbi:MAG TPA: hypothetical protein VFP50_03245 [Anaeromyxobacteraceae bacterium]|nr:hypothetical protein [Anaeromyxobacteraceae bacterium]